MDMPPASAARENMLKSQILTGHVLEERILAALMAVAREEFVPALYKGSAYVDEEIPLGNDRFLSAPLDFARLLQHAEVKEGETVLDIACATGYSAAVLARLARRVVAVEEDEELAKQAALLLAGLANVVFQKMPLTQGSREGAPYDVILIEGAIETLPQALPDLLREGGRLLAGEHGAARHVGSAGLGRLVEYRKVRGAMYRTILSDGSMAPIRAFMQPPGFRF